MPGDEIFHVANTKRLEIRSSTGRLRAFATRTARADKWLVFEGSEGIQVGTVRGDLPTDVGAKCLQAMLHAVADSEDGWGDRAV